MKKALYIILFVLLSFIMSFSVFAYTSPSEFGTYWQDIITNTKVYTFPNGGNAYSNTTYHGMSKDYGSSNFDGLGYLYYNSYIITTTPSPDNLTLNKDSLQFNLTTGDSYTYNTVVIYSLPLNLKSLDGQYFDFSLAVFGPNNYPYTYGYLDAPYQYTQYSESLATCFIQCVTVDSTGKATILDYGIDFTSGSVVTDTTFKLKSSDSNYSFSAKQIQFKFTGVKDIQYLEVRLYTNTGTFADPYNEGQYVTSRLAPMSGIAFVSGSLAELESPSIGDQQIINEIQLLNQKMDFVVNQTEDQIAELLAIKQENDTVRNELEEMGDKLDSIDKPDPGGLINQVDLTGKGYDDSIITSAFGTFFDTALISSMLLFVFLFALIGYILYGKK